LSSWGSGWWRPPRPTRWLPHRPTRSDRRGAPRCCWDPAAMLGGEPGVGRRAG
jgi:hypothetical protein